VTGATRHTALVTGWQLVASTCFYALFAGTALLSERLALSGVVVGLVVTAGMCGYTAALFPVGAAVDGAGERPVLVGGLVALGIGVASVGLAGGLVSLLVAAGFLGAAYATAMPATNRAIATGVPAAGRGRAMGLKQVGVTGGSALAALLVVTVGPAVGPWNAGFLAAGAAAVVVAALFAVGYRDTPGDEWRLPDLGGLRANRAYVALAGGGFFLGAGLFTTTGYATLYLTDGVGISTAVAGLGFAAMQVTGSASRVVVGWLADRRGGGARASAAVLGGQTALAVVLFGALALPGLARPAALALVTGLGATVLGFTGLYYACMTALVPTEELGAATAGGQTALNAGALLAPPAFGWLADTLSYRAGWLLLAGVTAVGAALTGLAARRA